MKKPIISCLLIIIGLLVVLTFSLCKKTDKDVYTAEAKIYNSGPIALDGCGWFLRIDSTKEYSPVTLPEDFMVGQGMKVTVRYRPLNTTFQCGWGAKLKQIEILDIKRKDPIALPTEATVINAGLTGADGCGWLLKVDTTFYSPNNLPEKYRKDNLKVKMAFIKTNFKYQCGVGANLQYFRIDLRDIQPGQ
ncbi:hypothetical protein [Mucilaginibacter antarcticus]|uniref:Uncharacterized protein n=1 Tax=Mucilaginibacter antarcticus TaxID=1855725 RepID=A0ABW5XUD5_9SPHI